MFEDVHNKDCVDYDLDGEYTEMVYIRGLS